MKQYNVMINRFLGVLFVGLLNAATVMGQIISNGDYMIQDGNVYTITSSDTDYNQEYLELKIPSSPNYDYILLTAKGADGGRAKNTRVTIADGGAGAQAIGIFKIGTGDNELVPGSTLRFLVGRVGEQDDWSGSGGGGTGVAYQEKGASSWKTLLIGGGGGGGAISKNTWQTKSTHSGGSGSISSDAATGYSTDYGGGGLYAKEGVSYSDNTGNPAIDSTNAPYGGNGGTNCGGPTGGWGYGGGGAGTEKKDLKGIAGVGGRGGGGGGYTGGEQGDTGKAGTGGVSYVWNAVIASTKLTAPSTSSPQDGSIAYQFTNDATLSTEIQAAADSKKCLDLENGSTDNNTNIQLSDCSGIDRQQWVFNGLRIRSHQDESKCINLYGGDVSEHTPIQLRDCYEDDDKARQHWIYDGFSGAFRSGKNPDYCIDLEEGSTTNDPNLQLAGCDDGNTQNWLMDGADDLADKSGVETIQLAQDTEMCMDLYQGDTNNSTSQVQLYQCTGRSPQQWVFDGLRIKYNQDQNKCVNLDGGNTSNGTKIKVRDCYDDLDMARQQWLYDGLIQSFRSGKDPKKCLTVVNGENDKASTFENDLKVKLYDCDGSSAQRWLIEG